MVNREKKAGYLPVLALAWALVTSASPVWADSASGRPVKTDSDDPAMNMEGVVINRILAVLRTNPDAVGDSCVARLGDMHKAQDQLEETSKHEDDPDIGLVRDVLASDMEEVISHCGTDAAKLCQKRGREPDLAKRCATLPDTGSETDSDSEEDLP